MKRTLLFMVCMMASLTMSAQDGLAVGGTSTSYHPFLREGKTWNYQEYYHNLWNDQQWTKEISYVINGTTEIDGKTYYKMYRVSEEGNNYYCALREEDRKVWMYINHGDDLLLYDFGMSVGDSYKPTYEKYYYKLTSITPMNFHYTLQILNDEIMNVFYYDICSDSYDVICFASVPIVEGVGCELGWDITLLLSLQPTDGIIHGEKFLSCYEEGTCIFTAEDFNILTKPVANIAYRPFIEEGKVWKVRDKKSGNPAQLVAYYYFDGDTIIDGKTCKQMMCQKYVGPDYEESNLISQQNTPSYVGAWYEEDKKVYFYNPYNEKFSLWYDFSLDAYGTVKINNYGPYVVGPRRTGGINGFKGAYRDVMTLTVDQYFPNSIWLEGIGSIEGPTYSVYYGKEYHNYFLMSCTVGDEVIYLDDEYEDGATPEEARKRFDFTHTIKTQPKTPMRRDAELSLYGEYNNQQLGINLDPLNDTYQVSITDQTGKTVYEKAVNTGTIVGLNIDISTYPAGRYTVTVDNSLESFIGEFEAQATGIEEVRNNREVPGSYIYNLQGQRLRTLQKGLNIVNGQKVFVK